MLSGADIVMEMYQKGELEQAGNVFNPIGFLGTQNQKGICLKVKKYLFTSIVYIYI